MFVWILFVYLWIFIHLYLFLAPVRVSAEDYTWNFFSIAMPSCSSVLVYVRPISGDPDLYLSQSTVYPTSADYTWYPPPPRHTHHRGTWLDSYVACGVCVCVCRVCRV
jgi:hypothetical protein